ncbi:hypothetical protein TI39_contig4151g00002, partial [Zymoseptoria brevis]
GRDCRGELVFKPKSEAGPPTVLSVTDGKLVTESGASACVVTTPKRRRLRKRSGGAVIKFLTEQQPTDQGATECVCTLNPFLNCICGEYSGFAISPSGVLGIGEPEGFTTITPVAEPDGPPPASSSTTTTEQSFTTGSSSATAEFTQMATSTTPGSVSDIPSVSSTAEIPPIETNTSIGILPIESSTISDAPSSTQATQTSSTAT